MGAHLHGLLQGRGDPGWVGVCMRHALAERHVVARKAHAFARLLLLRRHWTPLRSLGAFRKSKESFWTEADGVEARMMYSSLVRRVKALAVRATRA